MINIGTYRTKLMSRLSPTGKLHEYLTIDEMFTAILKHRPRGIVVCIVANDPLRHALFTRLQKNYPGGVMYASYAKSILAYSTSTCFYFTTHADINRMNSLGQIGSIYLQQTWKDVE